MLRRWFLAFILAGVAVGLTAKEVFVVGLDAAFPPFTWVEGGEYRGFDVEVMRAIAELQGLRVEFRDLPWATIITALAQGKIDIIASGLSVTCERAKVVDFSLPYWEVDQAILVRKDSDLNAITAFLGTKVGAQAGTTAYMWLEDNLVAQGVKVELCAYETYDMAVRDLEIGRIAAVLCDVETAVGFVEAGRNVKIVGIVKTGEQYAYAVTKGDPYSLLPRLNEGLRKLYELGIWAELVAKYFPGRPVEPVPLVPRDPCR
ncbi:transporter substrate-binding domain-containing protein [Candidatus Bipolaricaulota bacterium]|nr:transporter substrate-binding domain-containing protein [Candidatus Bipolaricaulota bacterium]